MPGTRSNPPDAGERGRRLRFGRLAVAPDWVLAVVACAAPVALLVVYAFGRSSAITQEVTIHGTIDSFRKLFGPLYRPVLLRSVGLSVATVALCVGIGTPAALAITRLSTRWQGRVVLGLLFPSFVSFTVRIFAWQGVLGGDGPVHALTGRAWLYTPTAVLIGMVATYVPLYVLPAYVAMARVGAPLLDAAADLGARRLRQTATVVLPLAAPGLMAGAVIVGVLSLGEFVVPSVLGGGKVLLIGEVLYERGATRDQPLGGAIVATMLIAFVVLGTVSSLVRAKLERRVSA